MGKNITLSFVPVQTKMGLLILQIPDLTKLKQSLTVRMSTARKTLRSLLSKIGKNNQRSPVKRMRLTLQMRIKMMLKIRNMVILI